MLCPPAVLMGMWGRHLVCRHVRWEAGPERNLRQGVVCSLPLQGACEPREGCWRVSGLCLYAVPWEDRDGEPHPRGMQEGDSRGDGDTLCQTPCFLPCLLMNTASRLSPGCFPSCPVHPWHCETQVAGGRSQALVGRRGVATLLLGLTGAASGSPHRDCVHCPDVCGRERQPHRAAPRGEARPPEDGCFLTRHGPAAGS